MRRALLVPTGNAECDLLSFVANRQFSATSPELPASEHIHATGSITKGAFAHGARRPYSGVYIHKSKERQAKQPRCQSAHEPRRKNRANPVNENRSAVVNNYSKILRYKSQFSEAGRTESVPPSVQEMRKQLRALQASTVLGRTLPRTQSEEGDIDAKLRLRFQLNRRFERKSSPGIQADSCTDRFLDEDERKKKLKAGQRLQKARTKKSRKNVTWKDYGVPLPEGTHFDNLIRSGMIAKHIAKKERKRRSW